MHWIRVVGVILIFPASSLYADQLNLKKLDQNSDGFLEPNEVELEDHSAIAQYAALAGADFSSSVPIHAIERGRLIYFKNLIPELTDQKQPMGTFGRPPVGSIHTPLPASEAGGASFRIGSNLRRFGSTGEFHYRLSSETLGQVQELFEQLDRDRNSRLSLPETVSLATDENSIWFANQDGDRSLSVAEVLAYFASEDEKLRLIKVQEESTWEIHGIDVTPAHRRTAQEFFSIHDQNQNGILEPAEIKRAETANPAIKSFDRNHDSRISLMEMSRGHALEESRQLEHEIRDSRLTAQQRVGMQQMDSLTKLILDRYQVESTGFRRGRLGWAKLQDLQAADADHDGDVEQDELKQWLFQRLESQQGSDLPSAPPLWFIACDLDGDGQVMLSEFCAGDPSDDISRFEQHDANRDGIVTAPESVLRSAANSLVFRSPEPRVLEATNQSFAEIFIEDDAVIADVDVQLTMTKVGQDSLELHLVGPDGSSAALYVVPRLKPWAHDRLFENTLIDDEAPEFQERLQRRPAHRSFRPHGLQLPRLNGLDVFDGKSARGTWRLVVHNKSGVALLDAWSLVIQPAL